MKCVTGNKFHCILIVIIVIIVIVIIIVVIVIIVIIVIIYSGQCYPVVIVCVLCVSILSSRDTLVPQCTTHLLLSVLSLFISVVLCVVRQSAPLAFIMLEVTIILMMSN